MSKNYMPKIAEALGVEIGEKFKVVLEDEIELLNLYVFTDERVVSDQGITMGGDALVGLLSGKYKIKKLPWIPKDGEEFWYVSSHGTTVSGVFEDSTNFYESLVVMGNCFKNREEATRARDEVLKVFEKIREEKND